jgi:hypothetical protein
MVRRMIEKIVIDYLSKNLTNDVPVYMEHNLNAPSSYVIVEKTGSSEKNHIYNATITIQSYAESLYKAAVLNEEVKALMEDIITESAISNCTLNSDYNYTDTSSKQYRYQAVYDLVHY